MYSWRSLKGVILHNKLGRARKLGVVPNLTFQSIRAYFYSYHLRNTYTRHVLIEGKDYDARIVFDNKLYFNSLLRDRGIPVAEDVGYIQEGKCCEVELFDGSTRTLASILESEKGAFFKPIYGESGRGAQKVNNENAHTLQGGVIQKLVQPSNFSSQINPSSLNTIRVVTIKSGRQSFSPFAAVLRVGNCGSEVDNWAAGGFVANVDCRSGFILSDFVAKDGSRVITHPFSGFKPKGAQIPNWLTVVDLAKKAHAIFPFMRAVGWDVALAKNGPVIIEGNHNFEMNFHRIFDVNVEQTLFLCLRETS